MVDSGDPDTIISRLQPFAELAPARAAVGAADARTPRVMANADLGPQRGRGEPHSRSALIDHVTPEFADAAVRMLESGAASFFQLRAVGGAVADVPDDETAYSHRSANFSVVALGSGSDEARRRLARGRRARGGDVPELRFVERPERISEAFPPETLARLRRIKAQVDPAGVFRDNFAIEPAVADAA